MKKYLVILLVIFLNSKVATAQKPKLESNKATNNYPASNLKVGIVLKQDGELGLLAKFISNLPISQVVITSDNPNFIANTTKLNLNTKTFDFNLDSPAYKGQNKYYFNFFVLRKSKSVWQSVIIRNDLKIK